MPVTFGRQRHPRLLHHSEARPHQPVAHLVHLFQPPQTAQLPEEEHVEGEAALRHHQQHGLRAVLKARHICARDTLFWSTEF